MKKKILFISLFLVVAITVTFQFNRIDKTAELVVDFGNPKSINATELISDCSYVALESSESSLLGNIGQIEIYNDRIYILDDKTNAFYVFAMDGKFIMKLEGMGNGPGEFISPHSFWIDKSGYIFILDRQLNRLLKYSLNNLEFADDITLPAPSPLSFAVMPNQDLYIYYYPVRQKDAFSGQQFIVADRAGTVVRSFYDAPLTGKILHGSSANFYLFNNQIRTYPHFSNQVYELSSDSLNSCYTFSWGDMGFPPSELFQKYDGSGEVMKEILTGEDDWIRLLYIYELPQMLAVKYYVKRDLYLSVWNKKENKTVNVKADMIADDLGFGGKFPLPIAVGNGKFVGAIQPFDVIKEEVKDKRLADLLDGTSEESNPILVFYSLKPLLSHSMNQ